MTALANMSVPFNAVIDIHEASSLLPISPDLDHVHARQHCLGDFPTIAAGAFSLPPSNVP